jgi:hypothetical protein
MWGGTLSAMTVECTDESAMAEKLCRQAMATSSATGSAIIQPIAKDSTRLTLDHSRIVCVRPQRSDMTPPAIEPPMFAT